ncbi:MAG: DMT family transporter [Alphaproteobacteria bacterium]|nr:DMT family transporter [Alphaproteobacteria bacterium]
MIPLVDAWVPITIAAVILQTIRSALQKKLKSDLKTSAVTFIRFAFGLPLAVFFLFALLQTGEAEAPAPDGPFVLYAVVAAFGQVMGTFLLLYLFSFRNFAVGTTYTKTEAIQTALFGLVLFGEAMSVAGFAAILISVVGVMTISVVYGHAGLRGFLTGWLSREAMIGLASGAGFAIASVAIRAASLSLGSDSVVLAATYTLVWVLGMQTVMMLGYFLLRDRAQLIRIFRHLRFAALIGLSSVLGSMCWFIAMTLENAAYVKTLGQIELVFTLLVSYLIFKERSTRWELAGMVLIVAGIVILLWAR